MEEIKEIDVRTRRLYTVTGNFHPNGDIYKVYLPGSKGVEELNWYPKCYSRVIVVVQYLPINSNRRSTIKFVYEQQNIIRVQQKLLEC